jgi:hypothetical protein
LAWDEVDGNSEEKEFHIPLRSPMKKFGIVVAPQPTPKTYLKVDSHVHSIIVE